MKGLPRIRGLWLFFIKHTLNHLTGRIARSRMGPFSLVRHVGRRSGKVYETPIIAQPIEGGFMLALTYGPDVDWYKNVRAAGGCQLLRHGTWYTATQVEPLDAPAGRAAFPQPQRTILRWVGTSHFVRLTAHQSTAYRAASSGT